MLLWEEKNENSRGKGRIKKKKNLLASLVLASVGYDNICFIIYYSLWEVILSSSLF